MMETQYHEAGHAVVGWATPGTGEIRGISMIPSRGATAHVAFHPPPELDVSDTGFERHLRVCLAGPAATYIASGFRRSALDEEGDMASAHKLIQSREQLGRGSPELSGPDLGGRAYAGAMLLVALNWGAVKRIADALWDSYLPGPTARSLIEAAPAAPPPLNDAVLELLLDKVRGAPDLGHLAARFKDKRSAAEDEALLKMLADPATEEAFAAISERTLTRTLDRVNAILRDKRATGAAGAHPVRWLN